MKQLNNTTFLLLFLVAQLWYFHVGRVCNDIHYSKNSCSLHTTYRILFFHNHRLVKTNFHTCCKHVSEPETNSSLSHAIEPLEMLSYQKELKNNPLTFPVPQAMKTLLRKSFSYSSGFSSHYFQAVWSTFCRSFTYYPHL